MIHQAEFKIRTYHTDAFGHVNNARYLELLEEARWQFADSINLVDLLREKELGFIIMDLRIRFREPVCEGDKIIVDTSLITLGTASGEVQQYVRRSGNDKIATNCLSHFILIERASGRSVAIEGEIRELLLRIIESEPAAHS